MKPSLATLSTGTIISFQVSETKRYKVNSIECTLHDTFLECHLHECAAKIASASFSEFSVSGALRAVYCYYIWRAGNEIN